jgi:excisionase family DNA binding protein
MSAVIDKETQRLLRVLGETALRLSDGQAIDEPWLRRQLSSAVMREAATAGGQEGDLLTVTEACGRLRISRWSLYELIHQQRLHTVTIGRRRFVARDELNRFVLSLAQAGGSV